MGVLMWWIYIFWMAIEMSEVVSMSLIAHPYGGRIEIKVFSPILMVKYLDIYHHCLLCIYPQIKVAPLFLLVGVLS